MSTTRVVNLRRDAFDQYIGRERGSLGGYFGNPFQIGKDGTREEVIDKFTVYFYRRLDVDPEFKKRVEELKGKRLGCFCFPKACHGDVIVQYLESGK
jgi:hypothetical protein